MVYTFIQSVMRDQMESVPAFSLCSPNLNNAALALQTTPPCGHVAQVLDLRDCLGVKESAPGVPLPSARARAISLVFGVLLQKHITLKFLTTPLTT